MQPTATTSADAHNQLQQFEGSLQTPQAALDAAKKALNVDGAQQTAVGLQGAIQNTTNLLNHVAPSVYGRTGNSLVTDAQATHQISNESAPLQQTLAKQGTDYATAEKSYEDVLGQAENQATGTLTQQQTKLALLQDLYNNLYTKETDAAKMAEQKREFDTQQAAATKAASANSGISGALSSILGGNTGQAKPADTSGSSGTEKNLTGNRSLSDAYNSVKSLLLTNNKKLINTTIDAIAKSAKYGNTYDQAKLAAIQKYGPQWYQGQISAPLMNSGITF